MQSDGDDFQHNNDEKQATPKPKDKSSDDVFIDRYAIKMGGYKRIIAVGDSLTQGF